MLDIGGLDWRLGPAVIWQRTTRSFALKNIRYPDIVFMSATSFSIIMKALLIRPGCIVPIWVDFGNRNLTMSFQVPQSTRFTNEYLRGGFIWEHIGIVARWSQHPFNLIIEREEYNPVQATALGNLGLIAGTWSTSKFLCKQEERFQIVTAVKRRTVTQWQLRVRKV